MPLLTWLENWPASNEALATASALLNSLPRRARVALACDSDVDGLCGARIAEVALRVLGYETVQLIAHRGEHIHTEVMRARIRKCNPHALVVLDMGSRAGAILPGLATVLIDHHRPSGFPEGAVAVSSDGHPPVAPTSVLAFCFFRALANIDALEWVAALGAVADVADPSIPGLRHAIRRYRKSALSRASSLLNAARRAPQPAPELAARVLASAASAVDIAEGRVAGVDQLVAMQQDVAAEVKRCASTRPILVGEYALIRFSSPAQVHGLVAMRWMRRLSPYIVIVANDGYISGRVNFAVRTARPIDLLSRLRVLGTDFGPEYGHGHARATGGSLSYPDFERWLHRLGFSTSSESHSLSRKLQKL